MKRQSIVGVCLISAVMCGADWSHGGALIFTPSTAPTYRSPAVVSTPQQTAVSQIVKALSAKDALTVRCVLSREETTAEVTDADEARITMAQPNRVRVDTYRAGAPLVSLFTRGFFAVRTDHLAGLSDLRLGAGTLEKLDSSIAGGSLSRWAMDLLLKPQALTRLANLTMVTLTEQGQRLIRISGTYIGDDQISATHIVDVDAETYLPVRFRRIEAGRTLSMEFRDWTQGPRAEDLLNVLGSSLPRA